MLNKLFCNITNWRQALIQFIKVFTTPDKTDPCKASINTNITGGSVDINLPDTLTVKYVCETTVQTGSFSDVSIGGTIPSGKRRVKIQNIGDAVGTITYLGGVVPIFAGGEFEASQIIEACDVTTIIKTAEVVYDATNTTFRITVID